MRKPAFQWFAPVLSCAAVACSAAEEPPERRGTSGTGGSPMGGKATGGSGGLALGGASAGGASAGFTSGGAHPGGSTATGGSAGGNTTGGAGAGGAAAGRGNAAGNNSGGAGVGGAAAGRSNTGGNDTGGAGTGSAGTGIGGGPPTAEPDCDAPMPSGGQERSGNGSGGEGNLGWEIWSNTGQGELTTYDVPAFIAAWNNAGGYLGRLGFEWGGFGEEPVPHDQRGTLTAQFVSKKTGTAGGYSYIGMYGWTTNPCVEWYVVDDSYNPMPINPGNTTNEGEVPIDDGTYIMYTRPTTGTGGTRCSGLTNWMQYYSVRKTARACGVISLSEHFRAWESLGMDMSGELLEAKILVEVGGGVGNVELPIANVTVH
jgi:endo-1,4-beta-xylanase